jgi:hypothetical protein
MAGRRAIAVILILLAIIIASGSIGAAYACYDTPRHKFYFPRCTPHPPRQIDLKICDQDETWADGVHETWTASNITPGDEFAFNGHFVGLRNQSLKKTCRGKIMISCYYSPWSGYQPDRMAKYMEITRCTYSSSSGPDVWQIDCLTGKVINTSTKATSCRPDNRSWRIYDVDGDGRITFYDLKKRPLRNLPSPVNDETRFEMSVRFHQSAGNEFQGNTFTLMMVYRLTME